MIHRDKRNIGKLVEILPTYGSTIWIGRRGKITGFRGNYQNRPVRIPFVTVFFPGGSRPIAGCFLKIVDKRAER
jgi:hypothetical protein